MNGKCTKSRHKIKTRDSTRERERETEQRVGKCVKRRVCRVVSLNNVHVMRA